MFKNEIRDIDDLLFEIFWNISFRKDKDVSIVISLNEECKFDECSDVIRLRFELVNATIEEKRKARGRFHYRLETLCKLQLEVDREIYFVYVDFLRIQGLSTTENSLSDNDIAMLDVGAGVAEYLLGGCISDSIVDVDCCARTYIAGVIDYLVIGVFPVAAAASLKLETSA